MNKDSKQQHHIIRGNRQAGNLPHARRDRQEAMYTLPLATVLTACLDEYVPPTTCPPLHQDIATRRPGDWARLGSETRPVHDPNLTTTQEARPFMRKGKSPKKLEMTNPHLKVSRSKPPRQYTMSSQKKTPRYSLSPRALDES
jgi:hypothetical protein